ncbi:MAG: hypothetical protein GY822_08085 [Deltaproteobacteria bacterium]|nr:hypothetical protein [Deltaproteobacteria bacterium]
MSDERRRQKRVTVNHEFASIEEFISEYVSDISRTGIFIRSDDPLPIGTKIDLHFSIIVDDFETIEGIGEVVRVIPPGGKEPPGMGVLFTELTAFSQALVERMFTKRK